MYNEYQEIKVKRLLESDFKKQYDLIPNEYKQNYYFEKFIFNLAEIYSKFLLTEEENLQSPNWKKEFNTNPNYTNVECSWFSKEFSDKNQMELTINNNGTINFVWTFGISHERLNKEEYNPEIDDRIHELTMKLDEDKQHVFIKYTTYSNINNNPKKCILYSMFDNTINEICRVSEAHDLSNNQVLFHEEFIPIGNVEKEILQKFKEQAEQKKIQLIGLFGGEAYIREQEYHQDIKEIYVAKCETEGAIRYALCWKPDCYVDKSFNASFQSISAFGGPYQNLVKTLDANETPWLIEITEEEYNYFIKNSKTEVDIKRLLK